MSGAKLRRLLVGTLSASTVLVGAGVATQTADGAETVAAGAARHVGTAGPDGLDSQHNETLVRDEN